MKLSEDMLAPTMADELRQWEAKALRDIERKGRVYRPFESRAIPDDEQARIRAALADATSIEAVKAAFKAQPKRVTIDQLADDEALLTRARKLREETNV